MDYAMIGIGVAIFIGMIAVLGYVKAPPDKAFIISGLRRKVVVGRSAIRIPFLERLDKLSLKVMSVDVKTGTAVPGGSCYTGGCRTCSSQSQGEGGSSCTDGRFPCCMDTCAPLFHVAADHCLPQRPRHRPRAAVCQLRLLPNGKARNIAVFHQNQPPFVAA